VETEKVQKRLEELMEEFQQVDAQLEEANKQMAALQQQGAELALRRSGIIRAVQELQSLAGLEPPMEAELVPIPRDEE
jgi:prefoldin subunit 5